MTIIIKIALFILGLYLSMRMVAALYRIIDLGYIIRTAYPRVLGGILSWGGITLAIAVFLENTWRNAFLWGLVAFVLFYLMIVALDYLTLGRPGRSREI